MKHLGDYDLSTVIYGKFTTFRPSTGAAFTLGGTPALSVYKDNSTTQSTTGVTLTVDFDSVTGLHHFAIDTSADGTFYSAGSFFSIVITTGTVDSVSVVGTVVAEFTLRKNSALKPATAGRTLVVDAAGLADANMVKVGPSGSGTAQTAGDIIGDTNDIQTRLPAALVSGRMDVSVGAMAANVITAAATATDFGAEIADAVWDEAISGHLGAGSTGAALNGAGAAGDPWTTPLPGAYGAGTAGYIVGNNLDATVSSRSSYAGGDTSGTTTLLSRLTSTRAGYLDNLSAGAVALEATAQAILADTGTDGVVLSTATQRAIADELLGRNVSGGSSAGRTVKQALHFIRNKWVVSGGILTVYDTDDTTSSWTSSVTGTAGADPVTGSDPA